MGISKRQIKYILMMELISIILIVVMFIGGIKIYGSVVGSNGDTHTYIFGYKPVIVVSGSMLPTIEVNSINIVKECSIDELEVGDIVMYKSDYEDILITHRVQEFIDGESGKELIAKGDNNDIADAYPIRADQVRGKIVYTWNDIAPILSDILPSDGVYNPIGVMRVILILSIIIMVITKVLSMIWDMSMGLYWVSLGDRRYKRNIRLCKRLINKGMLDELDCLYDIGNNLSIVDMVRVGLGRDRIYRRTSSIIRDIRVIDKERKKRH